MKGSENGEVGAEAQAYGFWVLRVREAYSRRLTCHFKLCQGVRVKHGIEVTINQFWLYVRDVSVIFLFREGIRPSTEFFDVNHVHTTDTN